MLSPSAFCQKEHDRACAYEVANPPGKVADQKAEVLSACCVWEEVLTLAVAYPVESNCTDTAGLTAWREELNLDCSQSCGHCPETTELCFLQQRCCCFSPYFFVDDFWWCYWTLEMLPWLAQCGITEQWSSGQRLKKVLQWGFNFYDCDWHNVEKQQKQLTYSKPGWWLSRWHSLNVGDKRIVLLSRWMSVSMCAASCSWN